MSEQTGNIYQKLAKVRKQVEVIRKNKSGYGYKYVTEDEILAKISVFMDKYHLSLVPSIQSGTTRVEPYTYASSFLDGTGRRTMLDATFCSMSEQMSFAHRSLISGSISLSQWQNSSLMHGIICSFPTAASPTRLTALKVPDLIWFICVS